MGVDLNPGVPPLIALLLISMHLKYTSNKMYNAVSRQQTLSTQNKHN